MTKKPKRPHDPSQLAKMMVDIATEGVAAVPGEQKKRPTTGTPPSRLSSIKSKISRFSQKALEEKE